MKKPKIPKIPKNIMECKPMQAAMEIVKTCNSSQTDPDGSYTGQPENPGSVPTQDVDDL